MPTHASRPSTTPRSTSISRPLHHVTEAARDQPLDRGGDKCLREPVEVRDALDHPAIVDVVFDEQHAVGRGVLAPRCRLHDQGAMSVEPA
jgi:hypothetical protein